MRLFLFLFFIMLKLHKPVILSEKQINKFQIEPKVMGIKLLHLIGINIFLVCRDASKPARNSCRNEGFWL